MMKTLMTALCVGTLSMGTMAATMVPVQAASYGNGYNQNHNKWKFEHRGKYAYLNGHRGDSHYHQGWRYYDGYYFPPAAFVGALIFGGILGGIIASQHH